MNTIADPAFGCELAQGRADRDGYVFAGRVRAHRAAWEAKHGPIPDGKVLDHLCRRRNCVALHHLEVVDQSENERRKSWRYRSRMQRCPRGHSMVGAANVVVVQPEGGRVCRTCNRDAKTGVAA